MKVFVGKGFTAEEKSANFENALRTFKRRVNRDGILQELRKREYYIKPGVKKRLKREAAARARKKKFKD